MNKKKIINDPIYGFITVPNELIFDIIEHRYLQRMRRIRQLGVSDFVYPGAVHSRFHHALGAMHLMTKALNTLRDKGHQVTDREMEAAQIAILLHDLGHGPFSHSLEYSIFPELPHEQLSLLLMKRINEEFGGALDLALEIFQGTYSRKFLNQLVSGQLDVDRLDYLQRDSFFTGVQEGTIGSDRIIKMLNLVDEELVVEEKGIYSIENFLSARRLMYWQVYLHKAAVSADVMLTNLIHRARTISQKENSFQATPGLSFFLKNQTSANDFIHNPELLDRFCELDDSDIWGSLKFWAKSDDFILSHLSHHLLNRRLNAIELTNELPDKSKIKNLRANAQALYGIDEKQSESFVNEGTVSNAAYVLKGQTINILTKYGEVTDVAQATDLPNIKAMSKIVTKYYLCYPKELTLQKIT